MAITYELTERGRAEMSQDAEDAKADAWDEAHGQAVREYDALRESLASDLENALSEAEDLSDRYGTVDEHLASVEEYLTKATASLAALRRFVEA